MESILCNARSNISKKQRQHLISKNNHRDDRRKPESILACKHFQQQGHSFSKQMKFIIKDKLVNLDDSKETLLELLVVREDFWIQKLKTLVPFGLNPEVSK